MSAWRSLSSLSLVLIVAGSLRAQTADLSENALTGSFYRVKLSMTLKGQTKVQQDGKFVNQPLSAKADHEYAERVLDVKKLEPGVVVAEKAARVYQKAQAIITLDGKASERTFRPDRRWLVAQRRNHTTITYCPDGSLSRDEIDLTEHFNTLALTGLLPGKEVKVGESWKINPGVVQTLCGLEALDKNAITCELTAVKGNVATAAIKGTANGIELGSTVKVDVDGQFEFDLQSKCLTSLIWNQKDERDQGPANPGLTADVRIKLERGSIEAPAELSDVIVGGKVPMGEVPADTTRVYFADPAKRFDLEHSRDWIMTAQSADHTVLRLMKDGALVAQATITPWPKTKDAKILSFAEFVEEIKTTPTWEEKDVIDQNESVQDLPGGLQGYRYAASGKLDGREVVQYFYLIAGERGEHVVVTFTMNPAQVKDLDARDFNLVRKLSFPTTAGASEESIAPPNK